MPKIAIYFESQNATSAWIEVTDQELEILKQIKRYTNYSKYGNFSYYTIITRKIGARKIVDQIVARHEEVEKERAATARAKQLEQEKKNVEKKLRKEDAEKSKEQKERQLLEYLKGKYEINV